MTKLFFNINFTRKLKKLSVLLKKTLRHNGDFFLVPKY